MSMKVPPVIRKEVIYVTEEKGTISRVADLCWNVTSTVAAVLILGLMGFGLVWFLALMKVLSEI